ncbi:PREDICTED: vitamin K-dependent protein Z isoform X3 [Rhinopithecus bieti]|uniref:vitamin K-dependent protein Z isoform X3 n=1 Tax=Rhinopithecus bieti TaxID=61621 RepID=UPI00083BBA1C|nr:PREDICTED: vitamin K-dependent protein Z isoform X3 [Rhinopithecus bieti]
MLTTPSFHLLPPESPRKHQEGSTQLRRSCPEAPAASTSPSLDFGCVCSPVPVLRVGMAGCIPLLQGLVLVLALQRAEPSVLLPASKANDVLVRWKRAGSYLLEELFEGNLEKECYEEICAYEEAREVFENEVVTLKMNVTWSGLMGVNTSASRDRNPTRAAVLKATGLVRTANSAFPTVKLTNAEGKDFCGGVIIHENFVLTTARCSLLQRNISAKTYFNRTSQDPLMIKIMRAHVHMRYDADTGENDLSLLELEWPIQCPNAGLPVCTPEKDFAEHLLIPRTGGLLSGWARNGTDLGNSLTTLPVTLVEGEECGQVLNVTVTTRTYCERSSMAAVHWMEGSVVIREHGGSWFLTGVLGSQPAGGQAHTVLVTKVSRYSLWFKRIMN